MWYYGFTVNHDRSRDKMAHTISAKVLALAKDSVTVELSGSTDLAHGHSAKVVELVRSLPYLIENGFSQSISDAGALAKGTPDTDKRAARKARFEALLEGYVGGAGRERLPLWVRLTVDRLYAGKTPLVPESMKRADVTAALFRESHATLAGEIAKARGLDPVKVEAKIKADVEWAKKEAARRAKQEEAEIDLDELK